MSDVSNELKQFLRDIGRQLDQIGITDYIFIVNYKGESTISTRMSPQEALPYLIDSLQEAKNQCFEQERNRAHGHEN